MTIPQCIKAGAVDLGTIFVDGTYVKARANRKKSRRAVVKKAARYYEEALAEEIAMDREAHGKAPLKEKDPLDDHDPSDTGMDDQATTVRKESTTDPDSGWFHKGEHKGVFAYNIQAACDVHGWILGYTTHPGNTHDSIAFNDLYQRLKPHHPDRIVADAGYKTPAIARTLIEDQVIPVFPYTRPRTKKGYFKKYEYTYDDYLDLYICPNSKDRHYSTTTREGYREYKSNPQDCINCPYLSQCTQSKNHTKVMTRHVWADYLDFCETVRHSRDFKTIDGKRKETIERNFGTAKAHHGMRYTQLIGKAQVHMEVGLIFACMNMKKLAKLLWQRGLLKSPYPLICHVFTLFYPFHRFYCRLMAFVFALK